MSGLVSFVLAAYQERDSLPVLIDEIRAAAAARGLEFEVVVVDDGSTDATAERCAQAGARVVSHPYRKGNGAAVKTGARAATAETLVFMDGDGQHAAADVARLLARLSEGFDMVVGARDAAGQANWVRRLGNGLYNKLAGLIVGRPVLDLTSGFRAVRAHLFHEFLPLFPNGFSYPTTVTMAFFRAGYSVDYLPVDVQPRKGRSHLRVFRDGGRFALIIFRIGN